MNLDSLDLFELIEKPTNISIIVLHLLIIFGKLAYVI